MEFERWRKELFGRSPCNPCDVELPYEVDSLSLDLAFDYLDRILVEPDVHLLFNEEQIALGISLAYNHCCTVYSSCYLRTGTEDRRVAGIMNLRSLYENFFARYWNPPFCRDSGSSAYPPERSMNYVCLNFWDRFVLFPNSQTTERMISAGLEVLDFATQLPADSCIASGLEALGRWSYPCKNSGNLRPIEILQRWVKNPTSSNPDLIAFGRQTLDCSMH